MTIAERGPSKASGHDRPPTRCASRRGRAVFSGHQARRSCTRSCPDRGLVVGHRIQSRHLVEQSRSHSSVCRSGSFRRHVCVRPKRRASARIRRRFAPRSRRRCAPARRAACSIACRRAPTARSIGSRSLATVVMENGQAGPHVRHLPRRHRARHAAPGIAHARQPAGSGGAARRARADRDRSADIFRRHRRDHRARSSTSSS